VKIRPVCVFIRRIAGNSKAFVVDGRTTPFTSREHPTDAAADDEADTWCRSNDRRVALVEHPNGMLVRF